MARNPFNALERAVAARRAPGKRVTFSADAKRPGCFGRVGESHPRGERFSDATVAEARLLYAKGKRIIDISNALKVAYPTCRQWVHGIRRAPRATKSIYIRGARTTENKKVKEATNA